MHCVDVTTITMSSNDLRIPIINAIVKTLDKKKTKKN